MEISVVKPTQRKAPTTNSSNPWFTKIMDTVSATQVAEVWSKWVGEESYGNQYSNMDNYEGLVAILEDGTEVECRLKFWEARTLQWAYWVGGSKGVRGVAVLPSNWVEIKYRNMRYTQPTKGYGGVSWETWTGKITVARRNNDGTATVFPIPRAIYRRGDRVEIH